ncbi:MAG: hypothetical protein MJK14_12690 [Rivularia sp. ALOHA_DT_140]|nr:hypothetical protein [Rivularia sp. ALOHA_DT_140]
MLNAATLHQHLLNLDAFALQSSEELSSDSAIVKIIENVEKRYISSQEDSQLSFSTNTKNKLTASGYSGARIQGVASQLCSQSLVLVTSENEILDVLTVSQQQVLENKIISEVANYWRFWRLSQESQDKKLSKRKNSFLKRLGSGYSRVQKALAGVKGEGRFHKYLQINPATIASLDTAVANLETNALVPVSSAGIVVKQRGGKLIQTVRQKLDIFLYGNREVRVNKVEVVVDGNLETQKSKIKALISAALQYFYGDSKNNQVKQVPPRSYSSSISLNKSKTPQLQNEESSDAWLSISDLFGKELPQLNSNNQQPSEKLAANQEQIKDSSEKIFGRFQIPNWRNLQLKEKAGLQQPKKSITTTSPISQKITITSNSDLQTTSQESTQVEAKPEWIETKAEIVGYQKHPLEQLLAWIDNTMLKIEEAFLKVATAFNKFWRK